MYRSRIGRRARRISDSKLSPRLRDRRVVDEDDVIENEDAVEIGGTTLTNDEVQGLLELLPYKEALIKIAKGEFEIEKVEEPEEEEVVEESAEQSEEAPEENFEEDEDLAGAEDDEDDDSDYDEYEDESEEAVDDSAVVDAWSKRLKGNN